MRMTHVDRPQLRKGGVAINSAVSIVGLLPPSAVVREHRIVDAVGALSEDEKRHVATAVPKRRLEFLAGRLCARSALNALGVATQSLPAQVNRCPAWPASVVGSITHSNSCCAAAVALDEHLAGIGIDIEEAEQFDPEMIPLVCTERERRRLSVLSPDERRLAAAVLFSAKESFFKCQYPLSGCWLWFQDLYVHTRSQSPYLSFTLLRDVPGLTSGAEFEGQYRVSNGVIATAVVLPRTRRTM
jgi:4'-phosphopantetheinyl transferase EntD